MKKILPVSLLAIWVACPVLAENFPNDGYMLENKTYDNAATYENMGVDSGSVDAVAEYANCPANSYCDASGQHSCPSGYPNSAAGAGASTECFKACTTENVPHSYSVRGNDYDGGTDTCEPTECVGGYHVEAGLNLNTIIGTTGGKFGSNAIENNGSSDDQYDLLNLFDMTDNGTFVVQYYSNKGTILGMAQCSTQSGIGAWNGASVPAAVTVTATLPDSSGQYCYCRLNTYIPVGEASQNLSGSWVFNFAFDSARDCAGNCSDFCAENSVGYEVNEQGDHSGPSYTPVFRAAFFGAYALPGSLATCEANTITINWSDVDGEDNPFATNVTYDGDIATPVKAATYPGKTFVGWRFVRLDDEYGS